MIFKSNFLGTYYTPQIMSHRTELKRGSHRKEMLKACKRAEEAADARYRVNKTSIRLLHKI